MSKRVTMWGRWCLPSFNKYCDQILKGELADMDNNMCNGKPLEKRRPYPAKLNPPKLNIIPWENPSLMVFVNSYGY